MKSLSQDRLEAWIKDLMKQNNLHAFYASRAWQKVQAEVLREQNYECQECKQRGRYTKATTVHHRFYVRTYPRLALTKKFNGELNLVAICEQCHYDEHHRKKKKGFTNLERW